MGTQTLAGRTAIVTGGLQGIGLAIAKELARQGARVAVGARSAGDPELAARVKDEIGETAMVAPLDVRFLETIQSFMDTVQRELAAADILVNAAGKTIHQTVTGHTDEAWEEIIDINLNGPFRMIRACLPHMKEQGWGRIVNIGSTAARVAEATHPAYCASKAGLIGLTRAVALEGGPDGITAVAVSPGWVETDMLRESARTMAAKSGRTFEEEIAAMGQSNPQNRLIQPEEIAALVAFCCCDAAAGLTMEDIQVNAGALW
ncbi:MAG: SDR family oxidoreductase [Rhizobiales bacterium]|nr:SDR family oxidoreductase [Hyphomicrobiales bacterium]